MFVALLVNRAKTQEIAVSQCEATILGYYRQGSVKKRGVPPGTLFFV